MPCGVRAIPPLESTDTPPVPPLILVEPEPVAVPICIVVLEPAVVLLPILIYCAPVPVVVPTWIVLLLIAPPTLMLPVAESTCSKLWSPTAFLIVKDPSGPM